MIKKKKCGLALLFSFVGMVMVVMFQMVAWSVLGSGFFCSALGV